MRDETTLIDPLSLALAGDGAHESLIRLMLERGKRFIWADNKQVLLGFLVEKDGVEGLPLVVDREGMVSVLHALTEAEVVKAVWNEPVDDVVDSSIGHPQRRNRIPDTEKFDIGPLGVIHVDEGFGFLLPLGVVLFLVDLPGFVDQVAA